MTDSPPSRLLENLNTLHDHITKYARPEMLGAAEKCYLSTRDYAVGDTIVCTPATALDNCEQIKCYLIDSTPKHVFENINSIKSHISLLRKKTKSPFAGKLWLLIILAAIAFVVYSILTHRY